MRNAYEDEKIRTDCHILVPLQEIHGGKNWREACFAELLSVIAIGNVSCMSRMCVYTQLDEALNLKQLGWLDDPFFHIFFLTALTCTWFSKPKQRMCLTTL